MATSTTATRRPGDTSFDTAPPAGRLTAVDWIALALLIIGGLNWGLVGIFDFDLVARLLGPMSVPTRAVYAVVALSALWCIALAIRLGGSRR